MDATWTGGMPLAQTVPFWKLKPHPLGLVEILGQSAGVWDGVGAGFTHTRLWQVLSSRRDA